ncbi:MAG: regulatory protein RecX [Candidatus Omnitrophica bacterium]|nr:regulatory protein RecX [Candidatus Omnitrophota bacterium]
MVTKESDKNRAKAKNYAYVLLRNRPRSEKELRERLKLKGFEDDVVDKVIADLTKAGYVNDAKFAKFLVDSRMHMNPVGDVLLKHQLKAKGISDSIIASAIEDKSKAYDEYELAVDMAKERFARFQKLDRRKAAKRVYDFLLRRGFKYDVVRRIIEEITNSINQTDI